MPSYSAIVAGAMVLVPSATAFIGSSPGAFAGITARTRADALSLTMQDSQLSTAKVQRRRFIGGTIGGAAAAGLGALFPVQGVEAADKTGKAGPRLPQDQWNKLVMDGKISKEAYEVLHNANTERPFTSKLLKEGRAGTFKCAACDTPLFASSTKFNSGTGWPSFYEKLDGVELEGDNKMDMLMQRQEVHCATCGGHLGHVFNDGNVWQTPTGKRYCINGLAIAFAPEQKSG